jgi:hypothetical protein
MEDGRKKNGGKREGAGRKPIGDSPKIQVAYWLDAKVVEIIRAQPNQAEFIEAAIKEKHASNP